MFDLTSSKLLLLGIIALLVVGPKDLPGLLRTVGRYVGMIKRQAAEFRTQFDDAIKESELADLKKEVETFGREAETAVREAETSFQQEVDSVQAEANKTLEAIDKAAEEREPALVPLGHVTEAASGGDAALASPEVPAGLGPPLAPAPQPAMAQTKEPAERAGA